MRSTVQSENPLYEKLYHRFSCDGKTVGEVMLCRARAASGGVGGHERCELRDITAERCITRANLLPREGTGTAAIARPFCRPLALLCKSPCALIALFLSVFILSYLLVSGIRHNTPAVGEPFLAAEDGAAVIYQQEAEEGPAR